MQPPDTYFQRVPGLHFAISFSMWYLDCTTTENTTQGSELVRQHASSAECYFTFIWNLLGVSCRVQFQQGHPIKQNRVRRHVSMDGGAETEHGRDTKKAHFPRLHASQAHVDSLWHQYVVSSLRVRVAYSKQSKSSINTSARSKNSQTIGYNETLTHQVR